HRILCRLSNARAACFFSLPPWRGSEPEPKTSELPGHESCFRTLNELKTRDAIAIAHRAAAWGHRSGQPAPRRITPREASINHVVGRNWATHTNPCGIESSGNT